MEKVDYDLVIIGGGPAGLTAGLYAARARLKVILVEKVVPGGQILITDWIENYPGFPEGISGTDLVQKMTEQVKKFDLNIETNDAVSLDLSHPIKKVKLTDRIISTHTIIIATGAYPRKLNIPGEETFAGKGVSYCATCDGPFFRDRVLAAVGGGDTAVQESLFLTKFAIKVYLIHRRDQLRASKIYQERAFSNDRIEFIWNSVVNRIEGTSNVEKIVVQNVNTGELNELQVDGCFIWVGINPNTEFIDTSVKLDEQGCVCVDNNMETSIPGVFAVGDVRHASIRQIAAAIGDSSIAAVSAEHYLDNLKI